MTRQNGCPGGHASDGGGSLAWLREVSVHGRRSGGSRVTEVSHGISGKQFIHGINTEKSSGTGRADLLPRVTRDDRRSRDRSGTDLLAE